MPRQAPSLLSVQDLHARVEGKEILRGLNLNIQQGEIHAIMGPNGSGKSTLVSVLMGHPKYEVTRGNVVFDGEKLLELEPDARARNGLFLAFQYPREIAGVPLRQFLFAAYQAQQQVRRPKDKRLSPLQFSQLLSTTMKELHIDPAFADRPVNKGFSGGEKKKAEVLQMSILQPKLALLDETDSGLDVDALKIVAEGVNRLRSPKFSAVIVTHYARILEYITPDRVHVMVSGKIVDSGGPELAKTLEKNGYNSYAPKKILLG